MYIPDVEPNSKRYNDTKPEQIKSLDERYDKAVDGAMIVKPSKAKSLLLSYLLPEDIPDIATYAKIKTESIIKDVVIPKLLDIAMDSISTFLNYDKRASANRVGGVIPFVSYNSRYNSGYTKTAPKSNTQQDTKYSRSFYEDIGFSTISAAEDLRLSAMNVIASKGYISVLQLYDLAGLGNETTPEQANYGWTSSGAMKIERSNGMYILKMPWPIPLN